MAPVYSNCLYKNNSLQSESENDSGSDSEGGESSASGSRSSSVDSANNQAQKSSRGSDHSRSPSPADSQVSGSSGSRGRRSRRDSASSASVPKGDGSGLSASGSPVLGEAKEPASRSPSPGDQKSGSGSPIRASEDGQSRSESPADDKSNVSEKNSDRSRSPSPEISEARKSRSRSPGSNNSRQSSAGSRSGSAESDNDSRHSKEKSESPISKNGVQSKSNENLDNEGLSERAGSKSPKKSKSQSGSDNSGIRTPKKSVSHKNKTGSDSPEKERSRSPSPQEDESRGSETDEGDVKDAGMKRQRTVLSDESASDEKKRKAESDTEINDGEKKDLVINAEALFGDASDISSDEEGKKKREKKASENEGVEDQGEESDAGSNKVKSGDEDNEMEVDEKDEDDKENVPEEPMPETRIDVQIPKITTDLGKEIHFVKLPNFLSVETRPFDPLTYEDEIDEEETLDEEGRARLKLKVENTIRWREGTTQNGEFEKQSNARFVKWSDGSMSLHLGSEIFDVCKQPLQGDHNHLFIRQGTGLQGQAVFRTKLTFRPHSTESFTHRKMTLSLADRSQKTARIKVLSLVGKDPEAHRGELIKKEEEKLRASVRRESKQRRIREKGVNRGLSAGYLEPDRYGDADSDDEGISISAIKKQHKNKLNNSKDDRSHIYSSDEEGSDIETRRARKLDKVKALKDSDSEESAGGGGGGGGGGGNKSGERNSSGED